MCGKTPFDSKADALAEAEYIRANNIWKGKQNSGGRLRPFLCVYCNKWHLTKGSKAREKKIKKSTRRRRNAGTT